MADWEAVSPFRRLRRSCCSGQSQPGQWNRFHKGLPIRILKITSAWDGIDQIKYNFFEFRNACRLVLVGLGEMEFMKALVEAKKWSGWVDADMEIPKPSTCLALESVSLLFFSASFFNSAARFFSSFSSRFCSWWGVSFLFLFFPSLFFDAFFPFLFFFPFFRFPCDHWCTFLFDIPKSIYLLCRWIRCALLELLLFDPVIKKIPLGWFKFAIAPKHIINH